MQRLPRVYQTLLELQMLDITTTPIEVAPTAHYSMGGVWVHPEDHSTGVEGLYAIGEASSGLHGANRLGGNSLIELLVAGRIAGKAAAAYSAQLTAQPRSAAALAGARAEVDELLAADGPENVRALQRAIRNTMTEHAGVVRDEAGLLAGLAELDIIDARMADLGVHPDVGRLSGPCARLRPQVRDPRRPSHSRGRSRAARDPRLPQPLRLSRARRRRCRSTSSGRGRVA